VVTLIERRGVARIAGWAYVAAVVLAFLWLYPIYAAVPLTPDAFRARLWLSSWR
jgi:dolichyl-phosphate-mannose--protein O-mannosyl transferase